MATYYNGNSEIQGADGLQTLVLMNPGYVYYSDTQQSTQSQHANFGFLDSNHPGNHPHANMAPPPPATQQLVGIPLSASPPSSVHSQHDVSSLHSFIPRAQYMYNPVELVQASPPELTTAERQEIQMKKAKLVNMLDEVEQRYKQYHQQMQLVISWFEQAAGIGSAKTYTALALQTISKQFRCLKDTIMGQIKAASLSLGEEDGKADGGGSRLKFADNQLRQQRALQQLGMIQHNAWRPQRGLPERSVSVLRAWLFEHFLHPYPKDSDKHMLAKQTGLTRSQVSNWFINARVRLWKPMVEEMYLEEIKEQEQNGTEASKTNNNDETDENSSSKHEKSLSPENTNRVFRTAKQEKPFHPLPSMAISTSVSTSPTATRINFQNPSGFSLMRPLEMEGITQFSPKKPRHELQQQNQDGGGNFTLTGANPTDFMGGLGGYPIGEIGRFTADQIQQHYSGNGVSLTLGLPHCENLSISGNHQNFLTNQSIQLGRGPELGEENDYNAMNPTSSSHTAALYESMNIQNRKRFAAQPLPDFVA
ncbi:putative transcription factor Homeodomain-TALE-BEL family [Helianthus debilis subsp. tardiflorus]